MSKIILEDFNGGDGYYKINLAYLNKDQIKEVEALVSKWNPIEETEDERIKKALIDFVKSKEEDGYMVINNFSTGSILAWLEKQGEQINLPQFTFDDVLALQCCMDTSKKVQKDEELYHRLQSLHDRLHDAAYWLGKQEESQVYETEDGEIITYSENEGYKVVEPKFRVGDWLVENEPNNYARFIQILEVVNVYGKERYKISRDLHNDEDIVEYKFIENNYHPFTIKDTKEGDVLTDNLDCFNNPFIFILKRFENVYFGLPKPSDFSSHCFLTMSNKQEFREGDYHHMHNICPATKEQRDLLFQKMHEANYEWDSKEKKLKEINSEWTSDDEQHLIICENALYKYQVSDRWDADIIIKWLEDKLKQREQKSKKVSIWKHWKDGIAGGEEGKQIYLIKNGLTYSISSCLGQECDYIELSELDKLMREQGKSKWSEDDEKMFNHIVGLLGNLPNLHNWLRSVKQRMKEC